MAHRTAMLFTLRRTLVPLPPGAGRLMLVMPPVAVMGGWVTRVGYEGVMTGGDV